MFVPFGVNCAPATGLRNLKIREFALPFDWVRSTPESLARAVEDEFKGFHESLQLSECKKYVIDSYGIQFPHDYPTEKEAVPSHDENIREDILVDDWKDSIPINKEKYARRIERFLSLMKSDQQIILVTTCRLKDISGILDLLFRKYAKTDILCVVLSDEVISEEEKQAYFDEGICLCDPETVWVDDDENWCIYPEEQDELWKTAIVKLLTSKKIELPAAFLEQSPCAPTVSTSSLL
jgi:hypothetical protein